MQTISFTQLRHEPKKLKQALEEGKSVDLIHRSKVIGEIRPKNFDPKPFNPDEFIKLANKLRLPKLSQKEMENNYRKHIIEKYGGA